MTTRWDRYKIFEPGIRGLPSSLSRSEARAAYDRLMEARPVRRRNLSDLVSDNGVVLGDSDEHLQELNDWFRENVEEDPITGRLLTAWYSVVNDIGLFLGDVAIERYSGLHWAFCTWGPKGMSYQRHVIMGFATEDPQMHMEFDTDLGTAMYANRILSGKPIRTDEFVTWMHILARRAGAET